MEGTSCAQDDYFDFENVVEPYYQEEMNNNDNDQNHINTNDNAGPLIIEQVDEGEEDNNGNGNLVVQQIGKSCGSRAFFKRETEQCIIVVVYNDEDKFRNEITKNKAILKSYGRASLMGYSDCIRILGGCFKENNKIALLLFGDDCNAQAFQETKMRPVDTGDYSGVELYIVPLCSAPLPVSTFPVALLERYEVTSFPDFNNYVAKLNSLANMHGGAIIAGSTVYSKWGTSGRPTFVMISQWSSRASFERFEAAAAVMRNSCGAACICRVAFNVFKPNCIAVEPTRDFIKPPRAKVVNKYPCDRFDLC